MKKESEKNVKTSFAEMDDDFLDSRFNPEYIKIFQDSIDDFESLLIKRNYEIPVHFYGKFDEKSKQVIQNLVNKLFVNAQKFSLGLQYKDPEVNFFTQSYWETTAKEHTKRIKNLPASRINWNNDIPFIELIIPEKITSGEEAIKTVRLLISKIFGKLFFEEHVPKKHAFRQQTDEDNIERFDLIEKIHFCRLIDQYDETTLSRFCKIGKQFHLKGAKAQEYGKREFYKELTKNAENSNRSYTNMLEDIFIKNLAVFKNNPEGFFDNLSDKIFSLMRQSTVILPYDVEKFRSLRQNRQWNIFHALDERLQLILNCIDELVDCRESLINADKNNPMADRLSESWLNALNERHIQLKKKGFAKSFLINGAKLSPKQQKELEQFPFWIWRYCRPEALKSGKNPVQKCMDQYKNSIYQKLYELSLRLITCVKALRSNRVERFSKCVDYQRMKSIFAWLEIRKPTIADLHFGCMVATQLSKNINKNQSSKKDALKQFELGWSYFISFAMVHQYFLKADQKTKQNQKRSDQFFFFDIKIRPGSPSESALFSNFGIIDRNIQKQRLLYRTSHHSIDEGSADS